LPFSGAGLVLPAMCQEPCLARPHAAPRDLGSAGSLTWTDMVRGGVPHGCAWGRAAFTQQRPQVQSLSADRHRAAQHGVSAAATSATCSPLAAAGQAEAAAAAAGTRWLDHDALARLAAAGLTVVGVAPAGDEDSERRLRQLGLHHVGSDTDPPAALVDLTRAALSAEPAPSPPPPPHAPPPPDHDVPHILLAVWGPQGRTRPHHRRRQPRLRGGPTGRRGPPGRRRHLRRRGRARQCLRTP